MSRVPSWMWSWAAFLLVAGVVMGLQYLFRGGLSSP